MSYAAIALPTEEQNRASEEETSLLLKAVFAGTHSPPPCAEPANQSSGLSFLPPEYFDDVQPPLLTDGHLQNSRLLASRDDIVSRLPKGGVYAVIGARSSKIAEQVLFALNPAKLCVCASDLSLLDTSPLQAAIAQKVVETHSGDVSAQCEKLSDGLFDLLFIHPDHTYGPTIRLLQEAARKINEHGWIVCADYSIFSPLDGSKNGVSRAVNEFCKDCSFEVLYLALDPLGCHDVVLARRPTQKSDHLGGASLDAPDFNTFMPDVWEYLIRQHGIQSVLDVGAGAGWSTQWFVENGLYTLGVEGCKEALNKSRCRSNVVEHDFTQGPFIPACRFDLAWCVKFVEQIEERFIPNFMASLQSCKFVCLTHAEPSQTGFHFVNCQPAEYWIEKMKQYGFDHNANETARLRSTASQKSHLDCVNLTFFVKNSEAK